MAPRASEKRAGHLFGALRRRFSLEDWLAIALVLLSAALYLWPVAGFSDDTDEGVYWQSLRAMAAGHPLFSSVFSSQAPLFLPSLYPFYVLFGQTIAAARIGVVIYSLAGIIALYWLGSMIGGKWAGLIAAALLATDFHYALQARTLQADAPAVAIQILAVGVAVAASRRFGRWRLALAALAGVLAALATLIKLVEIVALVPIALYLAAPLLRAFDGGAGRIRRPTPAGRRIGARAATRDLAMVAAGGVIATMIALAPFLGVFGALWHQAVSFHLAAAHTQPASLMGNLRVIIRETRWVGFTAVLALGVALWRRDWRMGPPLLWLLASIAILLRQVPLFDHIAIIMVPCMALMSGLALPMLASLATSPSGRRLAQLATLVTLIVFAIGLYSSVKLAHQAAIAGPSKVTQAQMAAIQSFSAPGEVIVTDDQYAAAAVGRDVPPELVDTSFVRVTSGYLTTAQLESILTRDHIRVVVLATGRLSVAPGFKAWLEANYQQVADLGNGDAVYLRLASGQAAP